MKDPASRIASRTTPSPAPSIDHGLLRAVARLEGWIRERGSATPGEARAEAVERLVAIVADRATAAHPRVGLERSEALGTLGVRDGIATDLPGEIHHTIVHQDLASLGPSVRPEEFCAAAEALARSSEESPDGVVFTPDAVARFMAAIGIAEAVAGPGSNHAARRDALRGVLGADPKLRSTLANRPPLRILDPAAGTGSFLLASARILEAIERPTRTNARSDALALRSRIVETHLAAVERDPSSVLLCRLVLLLYLLEGAVPGEAIGDLPDLRAIVVHGDSLVQPFRDPAPADRLFTTGVSPIPLDAESFHVVLANPPYVRQERIDPEMKRTIHARFATESGANFNRRSDLFVYFFAVLPRLLEKNGTAVIISSNAWLNAGYGLALRRFLKDRFRIRLVVEPQEERWFGSSAVNTGVTLLARRAPGDTTDDVVRFAALRAPLERVLADPEWAADLVTGPETAVSPAPETEATTVPTAKLSPFAREDGREDRTPWGVWLRAPGAFRAILRECAGRIVPLARVTELRFGLKTGANGFFYLRDRSDEVGEEELQARFGLARETLDREGLRIVEPSGRASRRMPERDAGTDRFLIEREFLEPVLLSPREIRGLDVDPARLRFVALRLPADPDRVRRARAWSYVAHGDSAGFGDRPSCAGRDPWWSLPDQVRPPVVHSLIAHERPSVFRTAPGILVDANLVCLHPYDPDDVPLVIVGLLSTFGLLARELYLLTNLGEGAVKANPAYLGEVPIPDPAAIGRAPRDEAASILTKIARREYAGIEEELRAEDRAALDDLHLRMLGIESERKRWPMRREIAEALRQAVHARLDRVTRFLDPGRGRS